jgi:hypothetical protein
MAANSDFDVVVLGAGSRPALPDFPGLAEPRLWTNRRPTDSSYVPGFLKNIVIRPTKERRWQRQMDFIRISMRRNKQ